MNTNISLPQELVQLLDYLNTDLENVPLRLSIFDLALRYRQYSIASEQIDYVLQSEPDNLDWRFRHAVLLLEQREFATAKHIFNSLVDDNFQVEEATYFLGRIAHDTAQFHDAIHLLMPLSERESLPVEALIILLRSLHQIGQLEKAMALFNYKIAQGCANAAAYSVSSIIAFDVHAYDNAKLWANIAIEKNAQSYEALVTLGLLGLFAKEPQRALHYLKTAQRLNQHDGRVWLAMGVAALFEHNVQRGLECLQKATTFLPFHLGAWNALGWCHFVLRDLESAKESFQYALEMDRNFGESHGGYAVVLATQGELDLAQKHIQLAQKLDPNNLSARYAQAVLTGEIHDEKKFSFLVQKALGDRGLSRIFH